MNVMSVREQLITDIVVWKRQANSGRGFGEFDAEDVREELEGESLSEVKRRWRIVAESAWSMKKARREEMDEGLFDGTLGDFISYQLKCIERGETPKYREFEDEL